MSATLAEAAEVKAEAAAAEVATPTFATLLD